MELIMAKVIIEGVVEKTKKSIARESSYLKELADDSATLAYINQLQNDGEKLPVNSPYTSFTEWREKIEKDLKTGNTSLDRISVEKAELLAFEYFMENAA